MKTRKLQELWSKWMATNEAVTRTLHQQTAALTLRDVARLEKIQPEVDRLMAQLLDIDEQAAACAKELAEELGTEPGLRSLVRVLDKAEAQQVQQLANKVIVAARNIEHLVDKNRKLIENELVYVNGTLTLIAKAAQPQESRYGRRRAAVMSAVLVDQAA